MSPNNIMDYFYNGLTLQLSEVARRPINYESGCRTAGMYASWVGVAARWS